MFSICLQAYSDSVNPENVIVTRFIMNKELIIKQVLDEYKGNYNFKNRIQKSKKIDQSRKKQLNQTNQDYFNIL